MGFELQWFGDDGVQRSVAVVEELTVGRGPRNDLVLPSDRVSYQHARFWTEGDHLWVSDLGSTNGTFVRDAPLEGKVRLAVGDQVQLGTDLVLHVRGAHTAEPRGPRWVVEDLNSGVRWPMEQAFLVGPQADAQLRTSQGELKIQQVHHNFQVVRDGEVAPLALGELVRVGKIELRVLQVSRDPHKHTVRPMLEPGRYHIDATIQGRSPFARIFADDGSELIVEGETRATLIYVLAQAIKRHRDRGERESEEGWVDDTDAVTGVWGRTAAADVSNRLSVVVYRLRSDLKKAGLDSSFVQRSRGRIRVRAGRITLS